MDSYFIYAHKKKRIKSVQTVQHVVSLTFRVRKSNAGRFDALIIRGLGHRSLLPGATRPALTGRLETPAASCVALVSMVTAIT